MKRKALTTLEAAEIGRALGVRGLIVHRDPTDRSLWQIAVPGRVETHEPMDEPTWRKFIAGWVDRPRTYEVTRADGRKVRVAVPENDEQDLFGAIREQLSPHAVAAVVSCLRINRTNNTDVDRQVHWFAEELVTLLGGHQEQTRLAEELGL